MTMWNEYCILCVCVFSCFHFNFHYYCYNVDKYTFDSYSYVMQVYSYCSVNSED